MTIGIIKEGKTPPDARVAFTPEQCAYIEKNFPVKMYVQRSPVRCFKDEEYAACGIELVDDVSHCNVLVGIKEVPIPLLVPEKTYFFFSHTIKKQAYNRVLLQAILKNKIRMIDYEIVTDDNKQRLIAFGYYAGIVGAHNGMMAYGNKTKSFSLPQMKNFEHFKDAIEFYKTLHFPAVKICVTGTGRVAKGAVEALDCMNIKRVSPEEYLKNNYDEAVYTQLTCTDYAKRKDGKPFVNKDFYNNPTDFENAFQPYGKVTDIFMNCIFWDKRSPQFFTLEEMKSEDFKIKVIADITCDIAPDSSVPSTLIASTIAEPVYGFDPQTSAMCPAYQEGCIDVMAIDNLPSELSKDASAFFGEQFINILIPDLIENKRSARLERSILAENGELGSHFKHLQDYVDGF